MPLILTSGPLAEPVTLAEAKAHCRIDGADEDTLITSLILAARTHIERALGIALITQEWSLYLDAWPQNRTVEIPLGPLQKIERVQIFDASGTPALVLSDLYMADTGGMRGRLIGKDGFAWPVPGRVANGIEIAFTAGFGSGATDVPQPLRQAVLMLVAHWYEEREALAEAGQAMTAPGSVMSLLAPYRAVRL